MYQPLPPDQLRAVRSILKNKGLVLSNPYSSQGEGDDMPTFRADIGYKIYNSEDVPLSPKHNALNVCDDIKYRDYSCRIYTWKLGQTPTHNSMHVQIFIIMKVSGIFRWKHNEVSSIHVRYVSSHEHNLVTPDCHLIDDDMFKMFDCAHLPTKPSQFASDLDINIAISRKSKTTLAEDSEISDDEMMAREVNIEILEADLIKMFGGKFENEIVIERNEDLSKISAEYNHYDLVFMNDGTEFDDRRMDMTLEGVRRGIPLEQGKEMIDSMNRWGYWD